MLLTVLIAMPGIEFFILNIGFNPIDYTEESYGSKSLKGMDGSHNFMICVHIDFFYKCTIRVILRGWETLW